MSKLDDLRAMVEAMTPGEWRREESLVCGPDARGVDIADCSLGAETDDIEWAGAIADAAGIVALRNNATSLLDVVNYAAAHLAAVARQDLTGDAYTKQCVDAADALRAALARLVALP